MSMTGMHPETKIQYTIDLTRQYHNLLQKEEAGNTQTFLWAGNVAGMAEGDSACSLYYLEDELGSPVRLTDGNGGVSESYGYDEFGQDLYGNQGQQPFGYTGYQMDRTAGTYFAQAREYRPELGRFAAADIIKGTAAAPYTLNEYGYCWNRPLDLVDLNGMIPTAGITNEMYGIEETPGENGGFDPIHEFSEFYSDTKDLKNFKDVVKTTDGWRMEYKKNQVPEKHLKDSTGSGRNGS